MNLRKQHRLVAVIISLPLLLTAVTGVVLLLRNQVEGLQPKTLTMQIEEGRALLTFDEISSRVGAGVEQIIYRPGKHNISVRLSNGNEIQMHPQTGEILKNSPRRTSFLIELHQGSWMGNFGQNVIHVLVGLGLIFLIFSGVMIWPFRKG